MYSVFPHLTYAIPYPLYNRVGKVSIYKSKGYSGNGVYLRFVEIIILKHYLVTRIELLVKCNLTSFIIKLLALLLILVGVY